MKSNKLQSLHLPFTKAALMFRRPTVQSWGRMHFASKLQGKISQSPCKTVRTPIAPRNASVRNLFHTKPCRVLSARRLHHARQPACEKSPGTLLGNIEVACQTTAELLVKRTQSTELTNIDPAIHISQLKLPPPKAPVTRRTVSCTRLKKVKVMKFTIRTPRVN
jgi:hypothetical protein